MSSERPICWVLTGPTATGKTDLALRLAEAHGCEIIGMDSMQIYRRMDIGTAKPTPAERARVPHHLIDVAEPDEAFSVARYQELAEQAAREIFARGRIPLFVGGTGFYLRALRHPMAMGAVKGNEALRRALEAEAVTPEGREALHRRLAEVDPAPARRLHVNDSRRVIRALEVWQLTGKPFSMQENSGETPPFRFRAAALTMDREALYHRVEQRVDRMIAEGLEAEVRGLLASGLSPKAQSMQAIGYKEMAAHLLGEYDLDKAIYEIKLGTRHYAKRQLTWLRREEELCWADAASPEAYQQVESHLTGADK